MLGVGGVEVGGVLGTVGVGVEWVEDGSVLAKGGVGFEAFELALAVVFFFFDVFVVYKCDRLTVSQARVE